MGFRFKLNPKHTNKVMMMFGGLVGYYIWKNEKSYSYSLLLPNNQPLVPWDWNWDKREPSAFIAKESKSDSTEEDKVSEVVKSQKPCATRHLIFIRHGQYNLDGTIDEERYLTKLGREQAEMTGKRLKELSWNYTRFVHSTMTRATQTAEIIYNQLDNKLHSIEKIESCDLLREGAPIRPEPGIGNWKAEMHYFSEGARIEAAFRRYFHRAPISQTKNSYEIFVCHANVIRYFVCRALQLQPEAWLRMSLHNGSITILSIRPDGRVSLKMLGDCGYMPVDMLTFN
ncbi:Serine/threonine-protein phosphatase PGAM5, mitochondrial [Armadillidium nasatum]|uniref:Serine/threonine-protein phosphatase PGAM5, mitochondrial n=1 Tax=Armadillidium nasatum TaxID=96803 RepID=A0A5N5TH05_9CRUS|nr:Serine/threonine-protein phosphatase PGAM5, mitochondrial [Armadillidium nasatum]